MFLTVNNPLYEPSAPLSYPTTIVVRNALRQLYGNRKGQSWRCRQVRAAREEYLWGKPWNWCNFWLPKSFRHRNANCMITRCADSLLTYSWRYAGDSSPHWSHSELRWAPGSRARNKSHRRCSYSQVPQTCPSKTLTGFEFLGFFFISTHTVSYPELHPREEIIGILLPMVADFQKHEWGRESVLKLSSIMMLDCYCSKYCKKHNIRCSRVFLG